MKRVRTFVFVIAWLAAAPVQSQTTSDIDAYYPDLQTLYQDIHRNPELAFQEVHESARKHRTHMRTGAYCLAVGRVADATLVRGLFP